MFEKMLVAVDASERRESTVKAAADLAKISGGEVEVLHVREGHFIGRAGAVPDEGGEEAQEIVDESVATLKNAGVNVTGKLTGALHGRVAREILDEAEASGASMIVMGSHGTSQIEAALIGSTTYKVLHLGNLPVLVVR